MSALNISIQKLRNVALRKIRLNEVAVLDIARLLANYDLHRALVERWAPIIGQWEALPALDVLFIDRKKHDARITELLNANTSLVLQLRDAKRASSESMDMIERLVEYEGDSVTILCQNPEGPTDRAIVANGGWTFYKDMRIEGENLRSCLIKALAYRDQPDADPCPGHVASDHDSKVCRFCGTHVDS